MPSRDGTPTAPARKVGSKLSTGATAGGSCEPYSISSGDARLFYGGFAAFLAGLGLVLAVPLILTYAKTGLVPRFPTAILATGMMVVAFLSFGVGLILDTVVRGRREVRRLHYLALPAVGEE